MMAHKVRLNSVISSLYFRKCSRMTTFAYSAHSRGKKMRDLLGSAIRILWKKLTDNGVINAAGEPQSTS